MRTAFLFFNLILISFVSCAAADTAQVFFDFNKFSINKQAARTLDSLENIGIFRKIRSIYIAGYADYVGDKNINNIISLQRAGAIKDYLAGNLFVRVDSVYIAGFGNSKSVIGTDADGRASDRFVYIIINHFQTEKKDTSSVAGGRVPIFIIKDGERDNIPPAALDYMDHANTRYLNGELNEEYAIHNSRAFSISISSPKDTDIIKRRLEKLQKAKYNYIYNAILLSIPYALQGKSELVFKYLNLALDHIRPGDEGYSEIYDPNILGFYQFSACKKSCPDGQASRTESSPVLILHMSAKWP